MTISLKADPGGTFGEILINGTPYARVSANGLRTPTDGPYFRRENILGTVSQSSSVPTGAVIERGSNANGYYVRFADGTQICMARLTATTDANFLSVAWSFPASFFEIPLADFAVNMSSVDWSDAALNRSKLGVQGAYGVTTSGGTFAAQEVTGQSITVGATVVNCSCLAIGRWF